MALRRVSFQSIGNGEQTQFTPSGDGTYLQGLGIDPDMPINAASTISPVSGGVITPIWYGKFSSTEINAAPMWIIATPESNNNKLYAYLNNGKLVSYLGTTTETAIGTATSSSGNGAVFYSDYIYLATNTDVSRYGPISGTPTLTNSVWTGATLGTQTALTNTAYPAVGSTVSYPNHPMHLHVDNKLYIGDYKDGRGLIHFIKTTATGGTNDGSTYNALDLPAGYAPTDIESYGNDLVISTIYTTTAGAFSPGKGAIFFWDTLSDSFYRRVDVSEGGVTALMNKNGELYAFAGVLAGSSDSLNGLSILRYLGGFTFEQVDFNPIDRPPLAGAVDSYGNRISWGSVATMSDDAALVIRSLGGKNSATPGNARHVTARLSPVFNTLNIVSAAKYVQTVSGTRTRLIAGWEVSNSAGTVRSHGLDNYTNTPIGACAFKSEVVHVDKKFRIAEIRMTLGKEVQDNTNINVFITYDTGDGTFQGTRVQLPSINNTNYPGKREITYKGPTITKAPPSIGFPPLGLTPTRDFYLELIFFGDTTSVMLPIEIIIDTIEE